MQEPEFTATVLFRRFFAAVARSAAMQRIQPPHPMTKLRFYEHFAAAYGTIWLVLMLLAICTGTHINAGIFGLVGFPVLALVYAFVRRAQDRSR